VPLVFVYGTLMRAGANHAVLLRLGGTFAFEASTVEPRGLVDLGPYPALLPSLDSSADAVRVHGEVWEIDDRALRELDAFEGCPDLYVRERVRVAPSDGSEAIEAFTYVLARRPPRSARIIPTGRYRATGIPLPTGAAPEQFEDALDIQAPTEDVARPRRPPSRRGPR
jgi:gamma-glutamylcyclotransferase (GGCT)/AIG2-like uncharacterized protein YtfP